MTQEKFRAFYVQIQNYLINLVVLPDKGCFCVVKTQGDEYV